jgi:hypothetical protein
MKKLVILSIAFLFSLSLVKGQTREAEKAQIKETKKELKNERIALKNLEGGVVSEKARNNFRADFPEATNATWKRVKTYDEVLFNKGTRVLTGYYDNDANLVGTTELKTYTDVPIKGRKEIAKQYPGYTPGQVLFYDDNEENETDMILYGIQFDDVDSYFVELSNGTKKLAVQVLMDGQVNFFTNLK